MDCGLFQGLKELRLRNWEPLPVAADSIQAVVLTHAHIDHSGYLPRLFAQGFKGRVFCTPGTSDLCKIVLPDAGRIAEEDAREANRHGYTKHSPALPLFTEADAYSVLPNLQPVGFDRPVPVTADISLRFVNSGHLLGSAFALLSLNVDGGREVVFSGDVGRYDRPIVPDPLSVERADMLLVESTYGDRRHDPDENGRTLADVVSQTIARGGKVIIPAFAIGRVEEVIYWLKKLEESGRIPSVPVFLDSPMALEALKSLPAACQRARSRHADCARAAVRLRDAALPGCHDPSPVRGCRRVAHPLDRDFVERDGDGRSGAEPHEGGVAERAQHDPVLRLPG